MANEKVNVDKINSLTKHLERTKRQIGNTPERQKGKEVAYQDWVRLEISRTESKIAKLKA